jgi:hypothetical protein
LIALDYATRGVRGQIPELQQLRKKLFVDNGNFPLIQKLADEFQARAKPALAQVAATERKLRRNVRSPSDLPVSVQRKVTALADDVADRAYELAGDGDDQLHKQLSLNGTHLIGVEDPTMAAFIRLNLEPHYLNYSRADYLGFNRAVASNALNRLQSLTSGEHYYPVASAVSYATAFDAGKLFADRGLENAAIGFGAFVSDRNDTDFVDIAGKRTLFPQPLPNRYVRAGAVAKGFWDGYRDSAGRAPHAFHFLGLGAPILVGIASLYAWGTDLVTFDATSPIADAISGSLYTSGPTFLKVDTTAAASRLVSSSRERWRCPCPFCRAFVRKRPFDYTAGRRWWAKQRRGREIQLRDLKAGGGLFRAYPLLSQSAGGPLYKDTRLARIGHNHWALKDITRKMRAHSHSRRTLERYLDVIVSRYEKAAAADKYADAIRFLYETAL